MKKLITYTLRNMLITYTLRNMPSALWHEFSGLCRARGTNMRRVIFALIAEYVAKSKK